MSAADSGEREREPGGGAPAEEHRAARATRAGRRRGWPNVREPAAPARAAGRARRHRPLRWESARSRNREGECRSGRRTRWGAARPRSGRGQSARARPVGRDRSALRVDGGGRREPRLLELREDRPPIADEHHGQAVEPVRARPRVRGAAGGVDGRERGRLAPERVGGAGPREPRPRAGPRGSPVVCTSRTSWCRAIPCAFRASAASSPPAASASSSRRSSTSAGPVTSVCTAAVAEKVDCGPSWRTRSAHRRCSRASPAGSGSAGR